MPEINRRATCIKGRERVADCKQRAIAMQMDCGIMPIEVDVTPRA